MTPQLLRHNPLALPPEPDFINDIGVKWWGINIGNQAHGTAVYVEAKDGNSDYLVIKDGETVYGTKNIEQLAYWFTTQGLLARDGESA